jgi:hypothetical protein
MSVLHAPLSNLQLELIKLFRYELPDAQLLEIRRMLARYFAQKVTDEMSQIWDERGWSEETIEGWKNEKMRSSK